MSMPSNPPSPNVGLAFFHARPAPERVDLEPPAVTRGWRAGARALGIRTALRCPARGHGRVRFR